MITKKQLIDLLEKISSNRTLNIDEMAMSIEPFYKLLDYSDAETHVKAIVKNLYT